LALWEEMVKDIDENGDGKVDLIYFIK